MPYTNTPGNVSIWYITNSPTGDIDGFDPSRPTILLLHPLYLDSVWLKPQFQDRRLSERYNMIAIDFRSSGKSSAQSSGAHDSWVDAADIAFVQYILDLPPFHIFAAENISVNAALRFSILFPEQCISLTLCNVPPPEELAWVRKAYGELLMFWSYPEDLGTFETACMELSYYMLGSNPEPNLQDEIIAHWQMTIPPTRRSRVVETVNCGLNRKALTDQELAAINVPVLLIHGDKTEVHPLEYAEELAEKLINVPGGAKLYVVKGGPEYITIVPHCSSIINRVFATFISQILGQSTPPPSPPLSPPYYVSSFFQSGLHRKASMASLNHVLDRSEQRMRQLEEFMRSALQALSRFSSSPNTIASRNPLDALSFSRVDEDTLRRQEETIDEFKRGEEHALSPLDGDGRPLRKFSERHQRERWYAHQATASEDFEAGLVPNVTEVN